MIAIVLLANVPMLGQDAPKPNAGQRSGLRGANGQPPDEGMVELSFSDEIELKGLVDYVSRRLGVNLLYDEQLVNKKITIKAPTGSLMALLQSVLKMKDLAVVDVEVAGWTRIVSAGKLSAVARPGAAAAMIEEHGELGPPVPSLKSSRSSMPTRRNWTKASSRS
jgi:hypothetical protein